MQVQCWISGLLAKQAPHIKGLSILFIFQENKAMSKAVKDRLARAQKLKEEELEQQRIERERKKQEHDEKLRKERERQQEKLKRLNTSESIPVTTPKKSPSPRKKPGNAP